MYVVYYLACNIYHLQKLSILYLHNYLHCRHVSHYLITYYLPSGLFVVVSWIRKQILVHPQYHLQQ